MHKANTQVIKQAEKCPCEPWTCRTSETDLSVPESTKLALSIKLPEPRADLLLQRPRTSTFLQPAANTESSTDVHIVSGRRSEPADDPQTRLIAGTRAYNGGGTPPPAGWNVGLQVSALMKSHYTDYLLACCSLEIQWEDSRGQADAPVTVRFYSYFPLSFCLIICLLSTSCQTSFSICLIVVLLPASEHYLLCGLLPVLVRFTCVWAQPAACSSFLLYFSLTFTLSPFSGSGRRLNPSKGTVQVSFSNLKMKVECL